MPVLIPDYSFSGSHANLLRLPYRLKTDIALASLALILLF
jgi:hypothetical protein